MTMYKTLTTVVDLGVNCVEWVCQHEKRNEGGAHKVHNGVHHVKEAEED